MDALLYVSLFVNLVVLAVVAYLAMRSNAPGQDVSQVIRQELQGITGTMSGELASQRTELNQSLNAVRESVDKRLEASSLSEQHFQTNIDAKFETMRRDTQERLEAMRRDTEERLDSMVRRIQTLTESNADKHTELQKTMRTELETLRKGNEEKLEKMRETVDEKLQGTLEKRLGESFKLVSGQLESVQKGLGEMQTLASDVGGLKRVLTNVKSRGTWGEVQLARQLEDVLSPDQYESNVVIKAGTRESVEFAIRMPGQLEGEHVYLPIDSKFPQEDYDRLLDAQDRGEKADVEAATKALQRSVIAQAKLISEKYISPPASTDFAIMYLPTEGLFAEVVRIPGLVGELQNQHRVVVSGPTMFATLLNSLQMGFRTLAIEKRSSEVWQVLAATKREFEKYGNAWEKLGKQLATAQNTVTEMGTRTRAVQRTLKNVETLDSPTEVTPASLTELIADGGEELTDADSDSVDEDSLS